MRPLAAPTDDASEVFLTCISNIASPRLKQQLAQIAPRIAFAGNAYESAGRSASLHNIPQNGLDGTGITRLQMRAVYNQRMARKKSPGRIVYDRLMAVPAHGRCPLCGQGIVSTLDHHLPQSQYPDLAVLPLNLVPACSDCNKTKHDWVPATAEHQTLHPYFDDLGTECWLGAMVVEESPPAVRFFIDPPHGASVLMQTRVKRHFLVFKLANLYASHAASELSSIQHLVSSLHLCAGMDGVRSHLDEQRVSRENSSVNSWQAATYRALTSSDWYCEVGFRQESLRHAQS